MLWAVLDDRPVCGLTATAKIIKIGFQLIGFSVDRSLGLDFFTFS
jgi:hypothetical protein